MFVDYAFYKNNYGGEILSESEFNREAPKACNFISQNTMLRVTDDTINSFPNALIETIKKCACNLSENYYYFDKIRLKSLIDASSDNLGKIQRKSAGQVSISYFDTSKDLSSDKSKNNYLISILNDYLGLIKIDGKIWNLLSKVLDQNCCKTYKNII